MIWTDPRRGGKSSFQLRGSTRAAIASQDHRGSTVNKEFTQFCTINRGKSAGEMFQISHVFVFYFFPSGDIGAIPLSRQWTLVCGPRHALSGMSLYLSPNYHNLPINCETQGDAAALRLALSPRSRGSGKRKWMDGKIRCGKARQMSSTVWRIGRLKRTAFVALIHSASLS